MKVKAAVLKEFKKPFSIEEVEIPDREGNVWIEVKATGICGRDRVIWKGGFPRFPLPAILGHEFVGVLNGRPVAAYPVITCGKCRYCRMGMENLCENNPRIIGELEPGGYASHVQVPENLVFELPDDRFEIYAAGLCPVATALHAFNLSNLKEGDTALVTGAGGGVGYAMVQVLRYRGIRVIAATSESKAPLLRELGVEVITTRQYRRAIKEVDAVFENVGSITINESLLVLRRRGTLVLIGNITGEPIVLQRPALSIMREHYIVGSAAYNRREYEEAALWLANGRVRMRYETFPLEEINRAYSLLEEAAVAGRAVLIP